MRATAVVVLIAVIPGGCARRGRRLPEEIRFITTEVDGFLRLEETESQYTVLFDGNGDGEPDMWDIWVKQPVLRGTLTKIDRDYDGVVDQWDYWQELRFEQDTNGDGRPDRWFAKVKGAGSTQVQVDTDFDGTPDRSFATSKEFLRWRDSRPPAE